MKRNHLCVLEDVVPRRDRCPKTRILYGKLLEKPSPSSSVTLFHLFCIRNSPFYQGYKTKDHPRNDFLTFTLIILSPPALLPSGQIGRVNVFRFSYDEVMNDCLAYSYMARSSLLFRRSLSSCCRRRVQMDAAN